MVAVPRNPGGTGSEIGCQRAHLIAFSVTRPSGLTGAKTVTYTYDADGNRASLTDPNGRMIAYSYTARGQVASILAEGPPPLVTFAYAAARWNHFSHQPSVLHKAPRLLCGTTQLHRIHAPAPLHHHALEHVGPGGAVD